MRAATICVCVVVAVVAPSAAWSQQNPVGAAPQQAPIGHRQPNIRDLPPDVARERAPSDVPRGERQAENHRRAEKTRGLPPAVRPRSRSGRAARLPGAGLSFSGVIRKRVSATKRRRRIR